MSLELENVPIITAIPAITDNSCLIFYNLLLAKNASANRISWFYISAIIFLLFLLKFIA